MSSISAPRVLSLYGWFLMSGGLIAFAMSGFEARAKTAIIMGGGCGALMHMLSYYGRTTRPSLLISARYVVAAFLALFMYRGYKIVGIPEKQYLLLTFFWLSAGSAITLALLLITVRDDLIRAQIARRQQQQQFGGRSAEVEAEAAGPPDSAARAAAVKAGGTFPWGPTTTAEKVGKSQ